MQDNMKIPIYKNSDRVMSVAVFLSGSGTNFDAIYSEQLKKENDGDTNYGRVDTVFTNVPGCEGIRKASGRGIPALSLSSSSYFDHIGEDPSSSEHRKFYDAAVITLIEQVCDPDLIVLAGYRRKLSGLFYQKFKNRIINMYPGDITKEYLVNGIPAYIQAIKNGEKELKCSAYVERENERFGNLLAQSEPVPIELLSENDQDRSSRIIRENCEWKLFPFVIHELIAKGRVMIDEKDNVYIDGTNVTGKGYQLEDLQM